MHYTMLYLVSIVAINIGFEIIDPAALPNGDEWLPMSLAIGMAFVLRDYAQREIGQRVLLVMLVGALLSYLLASPLLATASLLAYLAGEMTDWMLFSFTRWPLRKRVLVSSLVSAPLDSLVFLWVLGVPSVHAVVVLTLCKILGIVTVIAWQRDSANPIVVG
jgi:queuosine precursor transporter